MLHPEWLLIPAAIVAFLSWALWKRLGADRMKGAAVAKWQVVPPSVKFAG